MPKDKNDNKGGMMDSEGVMIDNQSRILGTKKASGLGWLGWLVGYQAAISLEGLTLALGNSF